MNTPNPAVVGQRAARRLPRVALYLLCLAYVLPGVFGRDPWKSAEISAVGHMLAMLGGQTSWLAPSLPGLASDGSVLPYWLGAASLQLLQGWVGMTIAARLPFALLLLATLALTWYATYYLARSEAAQPVAYAFGGEAQPVDYARAIADGAVLALMACLGLLQLGHETTPELVQLASMSWLLFGLAIAPYRSVQSRIAVLMAPVVLAASGAATTSLLLCLGCGVIGWRSQADALRRLVPWIAAAALLALISATLSGAWVIRLATQPAYLLDFPELVAWFAWPVWPLVGWTLWQWRYQLNRRHIALPLTLVALMLGVSFAMGSSDKALMLALPGMSVLAAFALPTLRRSVAAAIDWFSVFFFSFCALTIWVIYSALQTGYPTQPAANVARLAPEYVSRFQALALLVALVITLIWLWLVRWRTGRHREALWKSMVLPASGVVLNWTLLMTLWLPLLDHARSYRPLVERIARHVPAGACIETVRLNKGQTAALMVFGPNWKVRAGAQANGCDWQVESLPWPEPADERAGWRIVSRERRPTDREEALLIRQRLPARGVATALSPAPTSTPP